MKYPIYIFIILLFNASCENSDKKGLIDRDNVNTGNREIVDLKADEVTFLGQFDFYANYLIKVDSKYIYLVDSDKNKILQINKDNNEDYQYIGEGTGNGSGEIAALQSFDVADGKIVMFDRNNDKLAYFDTTGHLLNEYKVTDNIDDPHRVTLNSNYTYILSPGTSESVFYALNDSGKVVNRFENPEFGSDPPFINGVHSMLVYQGYINSDSLNNLYFSSYSESVIRKYNSEGALVYSVNKIESEGNDMLDYAEPESDQKVYMGYTESAKFSSKGLALADSILAIIKYDNTDSANTTNTNLVDIYSSDSGEYIKTFRLEYSPTDIAINNDYLYTVRYVDDKPALVTYKMEI